MSKILCFFLLYKPFPSRFNCVCLHTSVLGTDSSYGSKGHAVAWGTWRTGTSCCLHYLSEAITGPLARKEQLQRKQACFCFQGRIGAFQILLDIEVYQIPYCGFPVPSLSNKRPIVHLRDGMSIGPHCIAIQKLEESGSGSANSYKRVLQAAMEVPRFSDRTLSRTFKQHLIICPLSSLELIEKSTQHPHHSP